MSKIQLLPEHIIDQIKAGEVIERPASLLKEIVENAVDANSSRIDICIQDNGLDLMVIEDNGTGINYDDLPFAFCRHATSKISRFEDLLQLQSFGFRGEALASISSIAKVSCSSSTKEGNGGKIVIHGGQQVSHSPNSSTENGTSIYITDLFYNTPARLKFLRSQISEKNAIRRILNSFLLSSPHISWSFRLDDNDKEIFQGGEKLTERIQHIFKTKSEIIETSHQYDNHHVTAYTSIDSGLSSSGKAHFILVNNRLVIDQQIHRTILRTLSPFWKGGVGNYVLKLDVPTEELDVNVHPSKTTVKFHQPSIVFSLVSSALKKVATESFVPSKPNFTPSLLNDARDFKTLQSSLSLDENEGHEDVTQNSFIQILNDYYLSLQNPEIPFLLKGNILFSYYFKSRIEYHTPISEDQITPLLISEPINNKKSDSLFPAMAARGFDFDRLDSKTIVLRSIPNFAIPFSKYIISSFEGLDSISEPERIDSLFKEDLPLFPSQLSQIFDEVPLSELIENKIIKILKKEDLLRMLNE